MLVELPNGAQVNPERVWIGDPVKIDGAFEIRVWNYSGYSQDCPYSASLPTEAEARAHARELARMLNAAVKAAYAAPLVQVGHAAVDPYVVVSVTPYRENGIERDRVAVVTIKGAAAFVEYPDYEAAYAAANALREEINKWRSNR